MAANVVHSPPINFHLRTPASASGGFGFGMASSSRTSPWGTTTTAPMTSTQFASSSGSSNVNTPFYQRTPSKVATNSRKRGFDDEDDGREVMMENRSPTPSERPKRELKKLRQARSGSEDGEKRGEFKPQSQEATDIGVLLATLPPSALLPILLKLVAKHPSLAGEIMPLVPRPTLETALQTMEDANKKLRDAYPYTNASSQGLFSSSGSLFSGGTSFSKPSFGGGFGFGSTVGPSSASSSNNSGGMSDAYIQSRVQPACTEYINACAAYLPYFSQNPETTSQQKGEKCHPADTFYLISTVTRHVLSQPALTQRVLLGQFKERLAQEWIAWVDRVDDSVNKEGGMFGSNTVSSWVEALDEFSAAKDQDAADVMANVRERWMNRVGWLIGRPGQPMVL